MLGKKNIITMEIEGMKCKHCQMRVEETLSKIGGVSKVSANFKNGLVKVYSKDIIDKKVLKKSVESLEYKVLGIK